MTDPDPRHPKTPSDAPAPGWLSSPGDEGARASSKPPHSPNTDPTPRWLSSPGEERARASSKPLHTPNTDPTPSSEHANWPPPTPPEAWPPPAQPQPQPQPQPLGKAVERPHPLTGVAKSWIALFGLAFVVGREVMENGLGAIRDFGPGIWVFIGLALLVVLLSGVWGVIEWRTTTFVADDDEFRIERNFLSRESSRISYAKIQAVDIERSLAARVLGLASVQIDVGGAGGQKIEYLGKERADSLRDELLRRMRSLARNTTTDVPAVAGEPAVTDGVPTDPLSPAPVPGVPNQAAPVLEQVIEMKPGTLLLGLLVSSFLPWLIGAVAIIVAMLVLGEGFSFAAAFGVIFGVGSYLWSQIVGNWNFTLTQVPDGLHIRRGLFTTVSKSLKADRIQAVAVHQDYLQRLTGLYRVRVTVLGFGGLEGGSERSDVVLPYGRWADVQRVLAAFWPGINLESIELTGQPDRARWLTPLGFKRHQWGVDEHTLVAHHGWLDHTISLVPHRRMQSIGITQGPLQRRLRLATASIHTTDGPVNMEVYHLDEHVALEFFNTQIERARVARETPGEPGYLAALPAPEMIEKGLGFSPENSGYSASESN